MNYYGSLFSFVVLTMALMCAIRTSLAIVNESDIEMLSQSAHSDDLRANLSSVEVASDELLGNTRLKINGTKISSLKFQIGAVDNEQVQLDEMTSSEEKLMDDVDRMLLELTDISADNLTSLEPPNLIQRTFTNQMMLSSKYSRSNLNNTDRVFSQTGSVEMSNTSSQVSQSLHALTKFAPIGHRKKSTLRPLSEVPPVYGLGDHDNKSNIVSTSRPLGVPSQTSKKKAGARLPGGKKAADDTTYYHCNNYGLNTAVVIPRNSVNGQVREPIHVSCELNPAIVTQSSKANITVMANSLETKASGAVEIQKIESNTSQSLWFTMSEPGTYTLKCVDLSNDKVSCTRRLNVGYPPLDVQNFDCICLDYGDLECWFDVPYNPVQNLQNYTMCILQDQMCDTLSPSRIGTKHQRWTFEIYKRTDNLTFQIEAHNSLGRATFLHSINFFSRVKLDPPTNVTGSSQKDPLVYTLTWTENKTDKIIHDIVARVNISSRYWSESFLRRGRTATLRLPHHYVRYTVTVEIQPDVLDARYWSEPGTAVLHAAAAPPPLPPVAVPGMFEVVSSASEPLSLSLNWLPMPRELQAGPNFGYLVQLAPRSSVRDRGDFTQEHIVKDNFIVLKNLSREESYCFAVYSVNNCENGSAAGATELCRSLRSTEYFYSRADGTLPAPPVFPTTLYYYNYTLAALRWYPQDTEPSNYTLYYCTEDVTPCKHGVRFLHMGESTRANVSLDGFHGGAGALKLNNFTGYQEGDEKQTSLRFAVSADRNVGSATVSSGLVWVKAECYKVLNTPSVASPPHLEHLNASSHSVLLSWKWGPNNCLPPVVAGVHVFTCPAHACEDGEDQFHVSAWEETFLLGNLRSSTRYRTRLKILYNDGRESSYTKPVIFFTRPVVLLWWQVALVVGGTLLVLVVFVRVVLLSRKCLISSVKDAMGPLPVPDFPGDLASVALSRKPAQIGKGKWNKETSTAPKPSFPQPAHEEPKNEEKHSLLDPLGHDCDEVMKSIPNLTRYSQKNLQNTAAVSAPEEADENNEELIGEEKELLTHQEDSQKAVLSYVTLELATDNQQEEHNSKIEETVLDKNETGQDLVVEKNNHGYVLVQFGSRSSSTEEDGTLAQSQHAPYVAVHAPFAPSAESPSSVLGLNQSYYEPVPRREQAAFNLEKTEVSPYVLASFDACKTQSVQDSDYFENLVQKNDAIQENESVEETEHSVAANTDVPNNSYVKLASQMPSFSEDILDSAVFLNMEQILERLSKEEFMTNIQLSDTAVTQPSDTAGTQLSDTAGTQLSDTSGTQLSDTAGTKLSDTAGTQMSDTAGTQLSDTAGTQLSDTAGTQLSDTSGTQLSDTAGTKLSDTAGTQMSDTAGTQLSDTAGTQLSDTAGTQLSDTAGTQLMDSLNPTLQSSDLNYSSFLPNISNTKIFSFSSADIMEADNSNISCINLEAIGHHVLEDQTSFVQKFTGTPKFITGVNVPGHGHSLFVSTQANEEQTKEQSFDKATYDEGLGYSPTVKETEKNAYVMCAPVSEKNCSESDDWEVGNGCKNRHRRRTQSSRVSDLGVVSDFEQCSDDDLNTDSSPDIGSVQFPDFSNYTVLGSTATAEQPEGFPPLKNAAYCYPMDLSETVKNQRAHEINWKPEINFFDEDLTKILSAVHFKMNKTSTAPCALTLTNGTVTIYPKADE